MRFRILVPAFFAQLLLCTVSRAATVEGVEIAYETSSAERVRELTMKIAAAPGDAQLLAMRGAAWRGVAFKGTFWNTTGNEKRAAADFERAYTLAPKEPAIFLQDAASLSGIAPDPNSLPGRNAATDLVTRRAELLTRAINLGSTSALKARANLYAQAVLALLASRSPAASGYVSLFEADARLILEQKDPADVGTALWRAAVMRALAPYAGGQQDAYEKNAQSILANCIAASPIAARDAIGAIALAHLDNGSSAQARQWIVSAVGVGAAQAAPTELAVKAMLNLQEGNLPAVDALLAEGRRTPAPDRVTALLWHVEALFHWKAGRKGEARRAVGRALFYGADPNLLMLLGDIELDSGQPQEAAASYDTLARYQNKFKVEAQLKGALAKAVAGDNAVALKAYREALTSAPSGAVLAHVRVLETHASNIKDAPTRSAHRRTICQAVPLQGVPLT